MLHDEARITVRSGKGGDGCCSFRREAYVPEGGPDGGDGGRGGDVILVAAGNLNTLNAFVRKRHWRAGHGRQGGGGRCTGGDGEDAVIPVPRGTVVRHGETGELLADLTREGQRVVVAPGGRGGRGNDHFKSSTNRAPRRTTPGEAGIELTLALELKLIADVGLLGFPNAGKSTLLARVSAARPKVAAYPFTTLEPNLGVVERDDRSMVLADIPGLLEGAADGVGLGHRFLRHVERCRLLLHMVDASAGDAATLRDRIAALNRELARFSSELAAVPQILALNKADARPDLHGVSTELSDELGREVHAVSGVSGAGVDGLLEALFRALAGS